MYLAQAQREFDQGRYVVAASLFAKSSADFNETVLKFHSVSEEVALRSFLFETLKTLHPGNLGTNDMNRIRRAQVQRLLLTPMIVESWLGQMAELEMHEHAQDGSISETKETETMALRSELETFLYDYQVCLSAGIVFNLNWLVGHGAERDLPGLGRTRPS